MPLLNPGERRNLYNKSWAVYAKQPFGGPEQATEFIRRFCLHILTKGFRKIRHYGFLSNPCSPTFKEQQMQMGVVPATKQQTGWKIIAQSKLNYDVDQCPCCKKGKMKEILSFDSNGPLEWLIQKLQSQMPRPK